MAIDSTYDIQLTLNEHGRGAFFIEQEGKRVAEMEVRVVGADLIVYHTEVASELEGKGAAKAVLKEMVRYAREHRLKVTALCQFVYATFSRHPDEYADVWKRDIRSKR